MLKIIIIDDEEMSISYLKRILNEISGIEVVGAYQDSIEGLKAINKLKPDLVFLDIHMPDLTGIDIAKQIVEKENIKIVFITAHEQYAIKAFEIGVLDYVLKPFREDRIEQLLDKISHKFSKGNQKDIYSICTFKYFHFKINQTEIRNIKWRTAKAKELFIYLAQNYNEIVRKDVLIELLWQDLEAESAYENLYTTIYHVRRTLEEQYINAEIISTVHGYELDFKEVRYDVRDWLVGIETLNNYLASDKDKQEVINYYKKVMQLYKGDYLAEETYVWKENEQERLRILFIDTAKKMINYLMEEKEYTEATLLSLQIQDLYPYLDYSYFMLMQLYEKFDDLYNVERQYEKLKQVLDEEFNTKPNRKIQEWHQAWMKRQHVM